MNSKISLSSLFSLKIATNDLVKDFNKASNGYYNELGSQIYTNLSFLAMLRYGKAGLLSNSDLLNTLGGCDFVIDVINDNVRLALVYKEVGNKTKLICGSLPSLKNSEVLSISDNSLWWVKKISEEEKTFLDAVKKYYFETDINSILDELKKVFGREKSTFFKTVSSSENMEKLANNDKILPSAEILEEIILKKGNSEYFCFKKIFERKEENNLSLEF